MSRETENALLLLVGLSIGIITVTGAYTRYVRPSQLSWLAAATIFLIVLAATSIIRCMFGTGPSLRNSSLCHSISGLLAEGK